MSPPPDETAVPRRRPAAGWLLRAVPLTAALYGVLYFPYRSENVVVRALAGYLRVLARAVGAVASRFDGAVLVRGTVVEGRFPLEVVLDCSAADAQALLVGAVLAFPVSWPRRLLGAGLGALALNLVNVARMVLLYFVGARWPRAFHVVHEELLQLVMVAVAAAAFLAWALWATRRQPATEAPTAAA